MENISAMEAKILWGNSSFDHVFSEALGNSGGILCLWDPLMFRKDQHIISDNFVVLYGTWVPNNTKLLIVSVYAPQSATDKRLLWSYITGLLSRWNGEVLVTGDFNEVRFERERLGSVFNVHGANEFNSFISNAGLVEIQLEGYSFTWSHPSAAKMRFYGYGPVQKKLQMWNKGVSIMGGLFINENSPGIESSFRMRLMKQMQDIKSTVVRDQMQKAKIQWAVEGDENSKFFHGIVNRKRVHLSVKGVMVDGEWVDEPNRVPSRSLADQISDLEKPVSSDEIRKAVWSCGENKSPGPDGFTFEFFRKYWDSIGPDMYAKNSLLGVLGLGEVLSMSFSLGCRLGEQKRNVPDLLFLPVKMPRRDRDSVFRRHVRGGVETQQLENIQDLVRSKILSNVDDRWA
ncbi:RNA-directed DNA polymerase, eukaryota [Tanacetum coccineum]